MGSKKQWTVKKGQLRLEDVYNYGYVVDFFSSLTVWILQNIRKLTCTGVLSVVPIIESTNKQWCINAYLNNLSTLWL